jgi:hypothetical protein
MTSPHGLFGEYVGMALGAVSMLAGASVWGVAGAVHDWRGARAAALSRGSPLDMAAGERKVALMFIGASLGLHVGHWSLRRWFDRQRAAEIGMSNAAWRWLFIGCYAAGFLGAGLILFVVG